MGRRVGRFEIDDVAQQHALLAQFLAPHHDGLERQRAFAQSADHRVAAGLDALGNGDLALARQQLHRAHLAQIHAHRVVGAIGRLFFGNGSYGSAGLLGQFVGVFLGVGLGLFLLAGLVILDDVDAHIRKHRIDVLDAIRIGFFRRKYGIELGQGDIAALLRGLDHLFDGVIRKVEQRTISRGLAFVFNLFLILGRFCNLGCLGCHSLSSWAARSG